MRPFVGPGRLELYSYFINSSFKIFFYYYPNGHISVLSINYPRKGKTANRYQAPLELVAIVNYRWHLFFFSLRSSSILYRIHRVFPMPIFICPHYFYSHYIVSLYFLRSSYASFRLSRTRKCFPV